MLDRSKLTPEQVEKHTKMWGVGQRRANQALIAFKRAYPEISVHVKKERHVPCGNYHRMAAILRDKQLEFDELRDRIFEKSGFTEERTTLTTLPEWIFHRTLEQLEPAGITEDNIFVNALLYARFRAHEHATEGVIYYQCDQAAVLALERDVPLEVLITVDKQIRAPIYKAYCRMYDDVEVSHKRHLAVV